MAKLTLPSDRMPEVEVSLRLAFYLVALKTSKKIVKVAIDGASVKLTRPPFSIMEFLAGNGWVPSKENAPGKWQGEYQKDKLRLVIHSKPDVGDVVCHIGNRRVWAEVKKGPLEGKKGNPEFGLLRCAIGHLMTIEGKQSTDVLIAAVPTSPKFKELRKEWMNTPQMKKVGIQIVLVGRDGRVEGLSV